MNELLSLLEKEFLRHVWNMVGEIIPNALRNKDLVKKQDENLLMPL